MSELTWAYEVSDKIKNKMEKVAARTRDKFPYTTIDGRFDDWTQKNPCWWTNGFWGGIMWQLYNATKNELYRENAIINEEKLDQNLMTAWGLDHDNGFKWLPTAVANYRLNKSEESKNRGILAANNLAGRFNMAGRFIRAWNDNGDASRAGWAIIDCMMNLPLLYWASKETNDPRFKQIAMAHADTAARYFVREDGSVNHIVEFDPSTGEYVKSHGGQGMREGSTWTRGQAWAVYGFTLSYINTKEERYLETARRVSDHFVAHIPESGFIPVDFCQPEDCTWEDSTAAAIAACGLIELSKLVEDMDKEKYYNAAIRLLKALEADRCCWDENIDNILEKCTGAYNDKEHEFAIIYGDYYFIEAIWKLTGQELFIW